MEVKSAGRPSRPLMSRGRGCEAGARVCPTGGGYCVITGRDRKGPGPGGTGLCTSTRSVLN